MTEKDVTQIPMECPFGTVAIPVAYRTLCQSNACPSAETRAGIKSLIEGHERHLVSIQGQVERLKACLADIERQQVCTQDSLVKLQATLAPIRRVPPEILSEIFGHCVDAKPVTARSKEAPLLLGRVCRAWRAIAHGTPRLWRDIFINVCDGRFSDGLRRDALPVLQTWLAHSGGLPLNLVIACKTERVLPGLVELFEVIAAHGGRWKTVRVRVQNAPVIYRLACRALTKCSALSTLDVSDSGQCTSFFGMQQMAGEGENAPPMQLDLTHAPLRQLSLSLAGLAMRDVHVSWARLTRLSFMQDARSSTSSVSEYVAILRQCTSLREVGIAIDGGGVQDAPLARVVLPELESVELQVLRGAGQTTQTGDFLDALDAPRLSALSIEDHCPRREAVRYHGELKTFLHQHGRSLRRLRFSTSSKSFTSQDMIALIVETPALTELWYRPDEESSPKALLDALTPRVRGCAASTVCLLERLERLFVYWDTSETVLMVGDMIERRYAFVERGIARLTHLSCKPVRMYDCAPPHTLVDNLAVRLAPLCVCGLQVDWEAYRYDLEFCYS